MKPSPADPCGTVAFYALANNLTGYIKEASKTKRFYEAIVIEMLRDHVRAFNKCDLPHLTTLINKAENINPIIVQKMTELTKILKDYPEDFSICSLPLELLRHVVSFVPMNSGLHRCSKQFASFSRDATYLAAQVERATSPIPFRHLMEMLKRCGHLVRHLDLLLLLKQDEKDSLDLKMMLPLCPHLQSLTLTCDEKFTTTDLIQILNDTLYKPKNLYILVSENTDHTQLAQQLSVVQISGHIVISTPPLASLITARMRLQYFCNLSNELKTQLLNANTTISELMTEGMSLELFVEQEDKIKRFLIRHAQQITSFMKDHEMPFTLIIRFIDIIWGYVIGSSVENEPHSIDELSSILTFKWKTVSEFTCHEFIELLRKRRVIREWTFAGLDFLDLCRLPSRTRSSLFIEKHPEALLTFLQNGITLEQFCRVDLSIRYPLVANSWQVVLLMRVGLSWEKLTELSYETRKVILDFSHNFQCMVRNNNIQVDTLVNLDPKLLEFVLMNYIKVSLTLNGGMPFEDFCALDETSRKEKISKAC